MACRLLIPEHVYTSFQNPGNIRTRRPVKNVVLFNSHKAKGKVLKAALFDYTKLQILQPSTWDF